MTTQKDDRDVALEVAIKGLFLPYKWGGDDPMEGFDCSGFIIEVLKSVGILSDDYDDTAHGLMQKFSKTDELKPGNLVFYDWDKDGKADHVVMIFMVLPTGQILGIEAGGGNSFTTNPLKAQAQNAYIKIRSLKRDYIKIVDPF